MAELLEKQHEMQMKQSDATQHYEGKINPTKTSASICFKIRI